MECYPSLVVTPSRTLNLIPSRELPPKCKPLENYWPTTTSGPSMTQGSKSCHSALEFYLKVQSETVINSKLLQKMSRISLTGNNLQVNLLKLHSNLPESFFKTSLVSQQLLIWLLWEMQFKDSEEILKKSILSAL